MQADPRGAAGALGGGGGWDAWLHRSWDINNPEPGLSLGLALRFGHQAVTGCCGPVWTSWKRTVPILESEVLLH